MGEPGSSEEAEGEAVKHSRGTLNTPAEKEGPQHDKNVKGFFFLDSNSNSGPGSRAAHATVCPCAGLQVRRPGSRGPRVLPTRAARRGQVHKAAGVWREVLAGASDPSPALEQVSPPPPPSPRAGLGPGRQRPTAHMPRAPCLQSCEALTLLPGTGPLLGGGAVLCPRRPGVPTTETQRHGGPRALHGASATSLEAQP